MTKRKKTTTRKRKKKVSFFEKYRFFIVFTLILLFVSITSFLGYGYIHKTDKNHKTIKKSKSYSDKKLIDKMSKMLKLEKQKVDVLKKELKKIKESMKSCKIADKKDINKSTKSKKEKIEKDKFASEVMDYKKSLEQKSKKIEQKQEHKIVVHTKKPLLSIIMDDISYQGEVNKIKKLPFKITPSIFPPTKRHPDTPKLAREFKFYMVHLPMEAFNYPKKEPKTLMVTDSLSDMKKRLKDIKRWFPRDRFVNNHTGSLFTTNYDAMMRLFEALKQEDMVFVDSRTSAKTVAYKVARSFHVKLLSRDVFLDNKADIKYIKNQLKKAVKIAKKNGYAIAICHPHSQTFKALMDSSNILKSVKLVYIRDIYENSSYAKNR